MVQLVHKERPAAPLEQLAHKAQPELAPLEQPVSLEQLAHKEYLGHLVAPLEQLVQQVPLAHKEYLEHLQHKEPLVPVAQQVPLDPHPQCRVPLVLLVPPALLAPLASLEQQAMLTLGLYLRSEKC